MKPAREWKESDILDLIATQVQESLTLDYKACGALVRTDAKKKTEVSKDVSALANSAGGVIVYGVLESKHIPVQIDVEYDPSDISKEWLEQVINSNIQRRIDGIIINQVQLPKAPGRVLYIVSVPQSMRAPHMAADKRFYKRFNFESVPMEEYEVRDVGRRQESPDLYLEFDAHFDQLDILSLAPYVTNRSAEPAFYATFRLFLSEALSIDSMDNWWRKVDTTLSWNGTQKAFHTIYQQWSAERRAIILEDESYLAGHVRLNGIPRSADAEYELGYELRTPKMARKLRCRVLIINKGSPRIEERPFALERV